MSDSSDDMEFLSGSFDEDDDISLNEKDVRKIVRDILKKELTFKFSTVDTSDNEYYSKDVISKIEVFLNGKKIHEIGYNN